MRGSEKPKFGARELRVGSDRGPIWRKRAYALNVVKETFTDLGIDEAKVDFDVRLGICWVNDRRVVKLADGESEPILDPEMIDSLHLSFSSSAFLQALQAKLKRS